MKSRIIVVVMLNYLGTEFTHCSKGSSKAYEISVYSGYVTIF